MNRCIRLGLQYWHPAYSFAIIQSGIDESDVLGQSLTGLYKDYLITRPQPTRKESEIAQLTESQLADLRDAFRRQDKEDSGEMGPKGLQSALRELGHNIFLDDARALMSRIGPKKSGSVNFDEFVQLVQQHMKSRMTDSETSSIFDFFDKRQTGSLTKSDLKKALDSIGENFTDSEVDFMMCTLLDIPGPITNERITLKHFQKVANISS